MARVLVTGATGFIGCNVARLLAVRGDEVVLGVQPTSPGAAIADLDVERVKLDVRDRRSLRRALKGAERVFHCVGVTSVRPEDADRLFDVNVRGTKWVMEECLRAGVERVVCTRRARPRSGPPSGAGQPTRLVRSFLLGRVPVYTDGAVSIVDVRDAAEGHLLADERGESGERYILGGCNFTFDRLFADLGRLSGIEPPVKLPPRAAQAAAPLLGAAGRGWPLTPQEVRAAGRWWTYRSAKAGRELGWKARPHEETLEATVGWPLEREHDRIARTRRSQQIQYRIAGAAIGRRRARSACNEGAGARRP